MKKKKGKTAREHQLLQVEERPKVHLPKPIRVTPFSLRRNDSFECNATSGSSSQEREGGLDIIVPAALCNFKQSTNIDDHDDGVGFLVDHHHHHHHLVNGSDFECQSQVPTQDNTLEKLYEEYLHELLNTEDHSNQVELDSFAESLLI